MAATVTRENGAGQRTSTVPRVANRRFSRETFPGIADRDRSPGCRVFLRGLPLDELIEYAPPPSRNCMVPDASPTPAPSCARRYGSRCAAARWSPCCCRKWNRRIACWAWTSARSRAAWLVLRQAQIYGYLRHYHGTNVSGERQRPGTLVAWSTSGAGPRAKPKAPAVGHFLALGSCSCEGCPLAFFTIGSGPADRGRRKLVRGFRVGARPAWNLPGTHRRTVLLPGGRPPGCGCVAGARRRGRAVPQRRHARHAGPKYGRR